MIRPRQALERRDVSDERILQLLEIRAAEDVATILRISVEEVEDAWDRARGGRCDVVLRCGLTGRIWRCRSWRRAYFLVCLIGLTDWSWHREDAYNRWERDRARPAAKVAP